ncbi:MAG: class I SAM-dependent methyltransferase, partial [Oscillospiraceae bacterium]
MARFIEEHKLVREVAIVDLGNEISRQIKTIANDSPAFLEAYNNLLLFKEYFVDDVYGQMYENRNIDLIEQNKGSDTLPTWAVEKSTNIPQQEKLDFHLTFPISYGGAKAKFEDNIAAITLLKTLEKENRLATTDEQQVLVKYTGFGGISSVFDERKSDWEKEYTQLKSLLTPAEYSSARASTLTAFYTDTSIIKGIYQGLENVYKDNAEPIKILEPACGIGNFFSVNPFPNAQLTGIELDDLSGRIAKQLYQNADIKISGFENVDIKNNTFDVAIGNVPFGDFRLFDKKYDKNS